MLPELIRWATLCSGLAGLLLALHAWRTRPRGERAICPGYPITRWRRLTPARVLFRYRCGYDLTGLPGDSGRSCPECGQTRPTTRLLRPGGRARTSVLAFLLVGLFWTGIGVPWGQRGSWAAGLPTLVLVSIDGPAAGRRRTPISGEVDDRVQNGEVTNLAASVLAWRVTDGLKNDQHRWNADRARSTLAVLWPHSRPALEHMLTAGDSQARVLAAATLRAKCPDDPSPALLTACIVDIGSKPADLGWFERLGTCADAAEYLLRHEPEARELLRGAIADPDPHRRLVAAAIAGWAGDTRLMRAAVPVLVGHLAENKVRADAKLAAAALFRFGPAVVPLLAPESLSEDQQQRACVLGIIDQLEHPGVPYDRIEHKMPRISATRLNPLEEPSLGWAMSSLRF